MTAFDAIPDPLVPVLVHRAARARCASIHDYSPPRSLILRCALDAGHTGFCAPRWWERIEGDALYELMTELRAGKGA